MSRDFERDPRKEAGLRVNFKIKSPSVKVIDETGAQVGEMNTIEAVELANNRGLDLVEVGASERPPVCRMMDYGKFKYRKNKKAHEAKKNQKVIKLKEIKITPRTSDHDYQFKLKHITRFIKEDGSKVKITVFFRGRQITHKELGKVMLDRFIEDTKEFSILTQEAKMEGRVMNIILEPKKHAGSVGVVKKAKAESESDTDADSEEEMETVTMPQDGDKGE